ncbi:hypothetical protein ACIPUB_05145 [Paeniglutamicibacter sp. ORCA_105]|uniref:hypothetical protein n=1 Tax=Paeniglutamicibacter sp. ORCA_105 TaxID=3377336 RepID=UPI003893ADE2
MGNIPVVEMDFEAPDRPAGVAAAAQSTDFLPISTMDCEHALLTFRGNELLEVTFRPRTELKIPVVVGLLALVDAELERRVRYLLVDIGGLDSVDADVADIVNSTCKGIRIALLGSGPADRVLARFFMRKIDPLRQLSYVESRQDALTFLLEHD